jgi:1-deoxy-D-xylulose-5-phosphate reductoisomerase
MFATAPAPGRPRRISVLGATGSIGRSTLDLIGRHPGAFEVVALTAQTSTNRLAELARTHHAELAVIGDADRLGELKDLLAGTGISVAAGESGLIEAASRPADCVVAAIVGAAGIRPTFAAARQGRRLALANKECLVTAGAVFMQTVRAAGTELIPVDSEHSAAFQALAGSDPSTIEKITLTASGGPFRTWDAARLAQATPEEALLHPNWSMGPKVTIDSATLMNKGLELIEAFHLFPVDADQLDVVVHPQSIIHCLVSYRDGSVLAQLSCPDMRIPIGFSLAWPSRMSSPTERLDLVKLGSLTFEAPDEQRFPSLGLARRALVRGGSAPAILSVANEVAVEAFLQRRIGFLDIPRSVATCLELADRRGLIIEPHSLDEVLLAEGEARELARSVIGTRAGSA